MDPEKRQNLPTIIMLRDIIRKWWRAELHFADPHGHVEEWRSGEDIPPTPNPCCRLSLTSPEGLRRCTQSVRQLHEEFQARRRLRRALVHPCHLQFSLVGAPLYVQDAYAGFLFVEGFVREPWTEREREALAARLRELQPSSPEVTRAPERLPVLADEALGQLVDLLEYGAGEVSAWESERARERARLASPQAPGEPSRFENIIGRSGPMQEIFRLLEKVANSESTVLIHGESGTGKELVARAIHTHGPRQATGPSWCRTARPSTTTCWRARSSATCAAPSPAPCATRRACSRWPTAAPSSSTRWATCPPRSR